MDGLVPSIELLLVEEPHVQPREASEGKEEVTVCFKLFEFCPCAIGRSSKAQRLIKMTSRFVRFGKYLVDLSATVHRGTSIITEVVSKQEKLLLKAISHQAVD